MRSAQEEAGRFSEESCAYIIHFRSHRHDSTDHLAKRKRRRTHLRVVLPLGNANISGSPCDRERAIALE